MPCNCKKNKEEMEKNINLVVINDNSIYIPVKTIIKVKFTYDTNNTSSASCCIIGDPMVNGGEISEEVVLKEVNKLSEKVKNNNPKLGEVVSFEIEKQVIIQE